MQTQESLSGFAEGAKVVLKKPKFRRQGKCCTDLATKLEVPEVYEKAITAALGEAIDLLVLEDGKLDDVLRMDISASVSEKVALAVALTPGFFGQSPPALLRVFFVQTQSTLLKYKVHFRVGLSLCQVYFPALLKWQFVGFSLAPGSGKHTAAPATC